MTRDQLVSIDVLGHHITITESMPYSECYDVECSCGALDEEVSDSGYAANLAFDHGNHVMQVAIEVADT